jgi:acyl carrier protein
MNNNEVKNSILAVIKEIAQLQNIDLPASLKDKHSIVDDLGFSSLYVAALVANLEEELGIDPFVDEDVMITDVRTIKDLIEIYSHCLVVQ